MVKHDYRLFNFSERRWNLKESGIYKIENIVNGKVYIGQSSWLKKRIGVHICRLRDGTHDNIHLQRSWNKYGEKSFRFDIVEKCSIDKLDEREIYWICFFDSYNNGYNQTVGGGGNRGYTYSDESKQKMRDHHADVSGENNPMYGKNIKDYMTEEDYKKWRVAIAQNRPSTKGITKRKESVIKQSQSLKEYYKTHQHPLLGKKRSPEIVQRSVETRIKNGNIKYYGYSYSAKSVVCLNTGMIYDSLKRASEEVGVSPSLISQCINRYKGHHSAGIDNNGNHLVWAFYAEFVELTQSEIDDSIEAAQHPTSGFKNGNSKSVRCTTTGEIFGSAKQAGEKYKVDNSSISKCCKGVMKFAGKINDIKLKWEYI